MKKLIILPGNSIKNKAWGEGAAAHFQSHFDAVYMHEYSHWHTGAETIDIPVELLKLQAEIDADSDDVEYVVFAKSVGSLLALLAIKDGILKPDKSVFFGMPLDLAADGVFKDDWSALEDFAGPAFAFHNVDDPTANYTFTKEALEKYAPGTIRLIPRQGDNHSYTEYSEMEAEILEFLHE